MHDTLYNSQAQHRLRAVPHDLVRSRELLRDLVWKDVRVRYRYAAVGFLWAVLQPVALMVVLTFVFSFVLRDKAALAGDAGRAPFAVMLLCGLIFWQCFSEGVNAATQSIIDNQQLVKKVRFPREIVPLAAIGYPIINLGIGLVVLLALHLIMGGALHATLLLVPFVFALQCAIMAGLGLLLAAGNVHFRDIGYITNVALLFGFYASPVFYPMSLVTSSAALPAWAKTLYAVNPMAGLLSSYRALILEGQLPHATALLWPATLAVLLLVLGAAVFRRLSPTLSDRL